MREFYSRKSPRYRAMKVKGTNNPQEVYFANRDEIAEFVHGIDSERPDLSISALGYMKGSGVLRLVYVARTARGYAPTRHVDVYIGEYLVFNESDCEFSAWGERAFEDEFGNPLGEEADRGPGIR
jgi:hypothetical protein